MAQQIKTPTGFGRPQEVGEFREAELTHEMFALTGLWGTYLNSMVSVTADGPLIDFQGQLAEALERKSGQTQSPKKATPGPWGEVKREEGNRQAK